ncbi:MAG: lactate permease LctP family transporter [Selenomonadaceae bacterium]|nr:lactate permease LctP family transporter [Selenomonadaceae bacterium]
MFLLALSPILWLVIALSIIKMSSWKACLIALIISLAAGTQVWSMEAARAVEAVLEGIALACWPISLVIIAAIFTYNLALHTKAMDTIKDMLTSVSHDKRVLILLIGWGFGGFLEGMAGFGTAIAVPAGMLAGIGINPILSVSVCLIANSVPTAYGSIGIPLVTLASVTGFDSVQLATYTSIQLGVLSLLCPWLMVIVTGGGMKALRGMTMMCLGAGLSFFIPELVLSMFVGPELAVVAGAIATMGTIVFIAKKFPLNDPEFAMPDHTDHKIGMSEGINACLPFILIFLFLLFTSKLVPPINEALMVFKTSVPIYTGEGGSPYTFVWINTPGVLIMLAAFIAGSKQGASFGEMFGVLKKTINGLKFTILTIIAVIATAKVMGYSGMTGQIADTAVAATGTAYPAIAAFLGSVGTYITGSATSSCVLFGKLQVIASQAIGASPDVQAWVAAANATGACAGKMISPLSIAIGSAAIGVKGADSQLLSFAVKVYIPFVIFMAAVVYFGQVLIG